MPHTTTLTHFTSTDGLDLPGLLYEPIQKSTAVAIYLHGNGSTSIFYDVDQTNAIGEALTEQGIAYFPFNNRGAYNVKRLTITSGAEVTHQYFGSDFEIIRDCVADIDGAVNYLETLGFTTFYLIGASTGANKICVYNRLRPDNKFAKYVLVSGGDDVGVYYQMLGAKRFRDALNLAKGKVAEGKGRQLAEGRLAEAMGMISYQSLWDMLNPDGDYNTFPFGDAMRGWNLSTRLLFGAFAGIAKPIGLIYGNDDEYSYDNVPGIVEILKTHASPVAQVDIAIIPGADHGYTHKDQELAAAIAASLTRI